MYFTRCKFQENLRNRISTFDADSLGLRETMINQKETLENLEAETESLREQVWENKL